LEGLQMDSEAAAGSSSIESIRKASPNSTIPRERGTGSGGDGFSLE
jgi:hypothetical protein